jgi:hypothetical protein
MMSDDRTAVRLSTILIALLITPVCLAAQAPVFTASARLRWENWDWFNAAHDGSYSYLGALLRAGVRMDGGKVGGLVEAAAPLLVGLPEDAIAPPPQGQLGLGAAYFAANQDEESAAAVFVKQAFVRVGATDRGHSLRIGRFELIDGTETTPTRPTLAALKRDRIAHRLIGNFGWSHVQRSADGGLYNFNAPGFNITAAAIRPTRGVFRTNGWRNLDIEVVYAALSSQTDSLSSVDWRWFGAFYRDDRTSPVKVDNRPIAARGVDMRPIELGTLGAHLLVAHTIGSITIDGLGWAALQTGSWGALDHRAYAFAAEAGVQVSTFGKPWLRAGWNQTSGDGSAIDQRHETFFPMLPTPRPYARFPFYTNMNLRDQFVSLSLTPHDRVALRTEAHSLHLSDAADNWYAGGGAFEPGSFGYSARPSGGSNDFANLVDLSGQIRLHRTVTVNAYAGWAFGNTVVDRIYPQGGKAMLGYLDLEWRR